MQTIELIQRSLPLLLQGAWMTLHSMLCAACISVVVGTALGILTCNRLGIWPVKGLLEAIAFVFRAVPFYVQLVIAYFVLPDLFGINLDAYTASVLALGACSSGFMTQIVRCGINSILDDQWDSAATLGYSTTQCVRYIILPQMLSNVLPALTNELDALLKSTAILSSIGLLELTRMGMNIVSREMEPLTIYLTIAFLYVLLSGCIALVSKYFEKRCRYAYN